MMFRREASMHSGQSLIELLIGIAIVAIITGSVVGAVVLSVRINKQSIATKVASSLGQETLDDLRSISEGRWQKLYDLDTKSASSTYYIFNEDTVIAQDTIGSAGTFSSLVLDAADNPVIVYYDGINDDLKVLHCNDKKCAGDDESIETVDSGGFFNSIQLNGVNPVIAHYNDTTKDFKIVHCNDVNCSSAVSESMADARVSGLSLQLDGSGNPVVSYQRDVGQKIYLLHCNDPNCSGGDESVEIIDAIGVSGDYTSLQLTPVSGLPVVAYSDGGKLAVIRCNDVNCAGGGEPQNKVDTSVKGAAFISLALDAQNYPVVSYYDAAPRYDLKILRCNDINCTGGDESIVTVDATGNAGQSTSLQLDFKTPGCTQGCPVVSYIANNKLKILHCNDPNCLGGDESIIAVDDATPDANISGTSLRLNSLGHPVVSYYDDVNDDLKVLHCDDPKCDSNVFTALAIASGTESVIIGGTTYTRWFSVENVSRDDVTWDIVEDGGAGTTEDTSTQKITTYVQWNIGGDTVNVSLVEYFARWTKNRVTVFTDWSGNSGIDGPITNPDNNYYSQTNMNTTSTAGEMKLLSSDTTGNLISSTFDTGLANGVKINTVLWRGVFVAGTSNTKFQIASSDCSNGATDAGTCTTNTGWGGFTKTSGDGAFIGSDGTSSTYYNLTSPDAPYAIPGNQHNNKRYFRYNVWLSDTNPVGNCSGPDGDAWECTTVDATDDVGWYTSIAFDPSGNPWVSYLDDINENLEVAKYVGSGGNCDDVGAGSDAWECTTVDATDDVGWYTSIAFDPSGNPWVSYLDDTDKNLEVAKYVGSGGNCDDVGAGSDAWECTTIDVTSNVGYYTSIAFDPSGNPWVSYRDWAIGNIEIAKYVGSGGNCDDVDAGSDAWECTTIDITSGVGRFTSIAFDLSGNPWVSYRSWANSNLEVAKYVGSGGNCDDVGAGSDAWECTTVDVTKDVGRYSSIAFDPSGNPWISYYDRTNKNLEVAKYVGSGGNCDDVGAGSDAWECTTVDATDDVGWYTSIAFDPSGNPWVSYLDDINENLEVAKYVGSGGNCDDVGAGSDAWECTTVDVTGDVGYYTSIAFDPSGNPWVSYYDSTNSSLEVAKFLTGTRVQDIIINWSP